LNNYLLTESQVQPSQDMRIYFLTDSPSAQNESALVEEGGDDESVEVLDETENDPLKVYAHPRFLCRNFDFKKDPYVNCSKCYCAVCDIPAFDCKEWDTHCSMSKEQYDKARTKEENAVDVPLVIAVVSDEKEMIEEMQSTEKKLLEVEARARTLEMEKNSTQAALNDATIKLLDFANLKHSIHDLLNLQEPELYARCQANNINLKGKTKNRRNNYIVKLLEKLNVN